MKRYRAVQDFWYASSGCDCCEPTKMEFWQVYDAESGEEVMTNGTPYNEASLYEALLELNEIEVELECADDNR